MDMENVTIKPVRAFVPHTLIEDDKWEITARSNKNDMCAYSALLMRRYFYNCIRLNALNRRLNNYSVLNRF